MPVANNSSDAVSNALDADAFPLPIAMVNVENGCIVYANSLFAKVLQTDLEKFRGRPIVGLYHDDKHRDALIKILEQKQFLPSRSITFYNFKNRKIKLDASVALTQFNNQRCIMVALQNQTNDALTLQRINASMQRFDMALQAAQVGIWSWELASNNIVWDDIMHDLFGLERNTFSGDESDFFEMIHPSDVDEQYRLHEEFRRKGGEVETKYRILRSDGEIRAIMMRAQATQNNSGIVVQIIGTCWDVTENFALNEKIEHQAMHDPLTGLINRHALKVELEQLLEELHSEYSENTFCYFDIDRFKVINDTFGHEAGDALLSQLTSHLKTYLKNNDEFARMGGDEFAIIIKNSSLSDARKVADTLHNAAQDYHFEWAGKVFDINLSMALVTIDKDDSVNEILGAADVSLSAAKDSGRNQIKEYKPTDSTMMRRHDEMQWVIELEDALRGDRFQLNFQPIEPISNLTESGVHYEVLLRVIDKDGLIMAPGELLNAAEQFSMATRVDTWVINAVFDWLKRNPDHCKNLDLCSINLSGASIGDANFLDFIQSKLQDKEIPHEKISFEVTENAAIKNIKRASDFLKTIKSYGCKFALDDFGSGHSSFAYLKDLPVDILKIDGMFVQGINTEPVNYAMVKAINDVGKIMNMTTIAEYVEDEEVFNKLKEIGVDYGQGYYFGRSTKLEDIIVVESSIAEPAKSSTAG